MARGNTRAPPPPAEGTPPPPPPPPLPANQPPTEDDRVEISDEEDPPNPGSNNESVGTQQTLLTPDVSSLVKELTTSIGDVATRINQQLAWNQYGPYLLERIGRVNYLSHPEVKSFVFLLSSYWDHAVEYNTTDEVAKQLLGAVSKAVRPYIQMNIDSHKFANSGTPITKEEFFRSWQNQIAAFDKKSGTAYQLKLFVDSKPTLTQIFDRFLLLASFTDENEAGIIHLLRTAVQRIDLNLSNTITSSNPVDAIHALHIEATRKGLVPILKEHLFKQPDDKKDDKGKRPASNNPSSGSSNGGGGNNNKRRKSHGSKTEGGSSGSQTSGSSSSSSSSGASSGSGSSSGSSGNGRGRK